MDISQMRYELMKCPKYDSKGWHERVSRMPNNQIYAVYRYFASKGLLKPLNEPYTALQGHSERAENHQITIWEYLAEQEAECCSADSN